MALSNCEHCGSIEGGFSVLTAPELSDYIGVPTLLIDEHELDMMENRVCDQCGEFGGYHGIPESDDYDLER